MGLRTRRLVNRTELKIEIIMKKKEKKREIKKNCLKIRKFISKLFKTELLFRCYCHHIVDYYGLS